MAISSFQARAFSGSLIRKIKLGFVSGQSFMCAQIDLLLDRADRCINICEIKYSSAPYVVTKSYAEELRRKLRVFNQRSGRKQILFLTMITPEGIKSNQYTEELFTNQVILGDLFATK